MLVAGAGSTFTQTGAGATFTLGSSNTGTGTLTVRDGGTYTTGDGAVSVEATGTLNIEQGGTFVANGVLTKGLFGDINLDGGTLVANAGIDVPFGFSTIQDATLTLAGGNSQLRTNFTSALNGERRLQWNGVINVTGETSLDIRDAGDPSRLGIVGFITNLNLREGGAFTTRQLRDAGVFTIDGMDASGTPSTLSVVGDFLDNSGLQVVTGTIEVTNGGRLLAERASIENIGSLSVIGGGSTFVNSGDVFLGAETSTDGVLRIEDGGLVEVQGNLDFSRGNLSSSDQVVLGGGTLQLASGVSGVGRITGPGVVNIMSPNVGLVASSGGVVKMGDLFLDFEGDFGFLTRYAINSTFNLPSPARIEFGGRLQMGGGNLNSDGIFIESGGTLANTVGNSTVPTRIVAEAGSTIAVEAGTLDAGDATVVNGFYSNGTLTVAGGTRLTLLDANDAVLDSGALAELGEAGASATLQADNGLTLDFGGNVTGFGTVETPDDATKPFINNGSIRGESLAEPITLTGYVKGVGTLDNAVITGTDAPGFSPASVLRGSVIYDGTLEVEIGGTSPGSDFDQLNHLLGDGVADLGGALEVLLLDSFMPELGDSFEILTAMSVLGEFDSELLPSLDAGLQFEVEYSATSVLLNVVSSAIPGDYNGDNVVNAADYTVWRDALGSSLNLPGDTTPGSVTIADYNVWRANFGQSNQSAASAATAPEPSSLVGLAALISLATIAQRHLRR